MLMLVAIIASASALGALVLGVSLCRVAAASDYWTESSPDEPRSVVLALEPARANGRSSASGAHG